MSDIFDRLVFVIESVISKQASPITNESTFENDMACDSLDMVEIIMAAEEEFEIEISDKDADDCKNVGDLVALIKRSTEGT